MRVLFISHFFPPEEPPAAFLAYEFAKAVKQAGHEVDVLTGFPNWPKGHVFSGYSSRSFIVENMDNLNIHRLPFLASPSGGFVKRALDFLSFSLLVKWYGRRISRPDLIYVLAPPNEDGLAARSLSKFFHCPYVLNIQDVHPDTAINLGFIKNRFLINLLQNQEMRMYDSANHVVTIGASMKQTLIKKGIKPENISILPNWIDTRTVSPSDRNNLLRQEWNIDEKKFVALYAGTFGRIHGTSVLLDVAKEIQNENIVLILVGQGYGFNQIRERAMELG